MDLPSVFNKYRTDIDIELKSILDGQHLPLYDMMRYHLGWLDEKGNSVPGNAGKALRPTLCLMACEAVGSDFHQALPAAAALELVHNYSLIHDDIQDNDMERRHRPTVWSIWGMPQAINAGTGMRMVASQALRRLVELGVPDQKQLRAHYLLDDVCLRIIEGQYLDISFETRVDVTVEDYLDMISKKTAALIACSLELGTLLGTDDVRVIDIFRQIGTNLGLAFQIRDDILGIWGDEKKTGKPVASDIKKKKKSFPIIWAFNHARGEQHTRLLDFYRNGIATPKGTQLVLEVLDGADAQNQSQKMVAKYHKEARAAVDELSLPVSATRDLQELLTFLVERDF